MVEFIIIVAALMFVYGVFKVVASLGPSGKTQRQRKPPAHPQAKSTGVPIDNRTLQRAMRHNEKNGVPRDNGY